MKWSITRIEARKDGREGDLTVELNLASALLRYLTCNTAVKSNTKVNK